MDDHELTERIRAAAEKARPAKKLLTAEDKPGTASASPKSEDGKNATAWAETP